MTPFRQGGALILLYDGLHKLCGLFHDVLLFVKICNISYLAQVREISRAAGLIYGCNLLFSFITTNILKRAKKVQFTSINLKVAISDELQQVRWVGSYKYYLTSKLFVGLKALKTFTSFYLSFVLLTPMPPL